MPNDHNDEPKQKFNATFRRLFPEVAKSGFPKDLKRPTFEELRETCRKFGNAEDLYGTAQVPPAPGTLTHDKRGA